MGKTPLNQGLKIALAIFIILATVGCQNQRRMRGSQVPLQKNVDSDTEKILSQIKTLQENQQAINDTVDSMKTDQLTIATKIAGNQRQLANQVTEIAMSIRQKQVDLKTTFQNANAQLVTQVQDLTEQQQGLKVTTEATETNGQTLRTTQEQLLAQLTELKDGYQHWQDRLTLMQEKMAALDTSVMAMQAGVSQFENTLTQDIKDLTTKNALQRDKRQGTDQGLQRQLTRLTQMLTEAGALQKHLLVLFQDGDKTAEIQDKEHGDVNQLEEQESDQPPL